MKRTFDLIGSIHEHLAGTGYRRLPIKKDASALFFKPVSGLILTLGVEVSRRYSQTFTGSFYLAPTFSWAYAPPNGFPLKGFRRIGECLTPSQRKQIEPDPARIDLPCNSSFRRRPLVPRSGSACKSRSCSGRSWCHHKPWS